MTDKDYMQRALDVARKAQSEGEPPFGAVIVGPDGKIIAEGSDEVNRRRDLTWHAEVIAVHGACAAVGPVLLGHTLYSTVEPCPMCFTNAWLARISRIVYACKMQQVKVATKGAQREVLVDVEWMNENSGEPVDLLGGILADESLDLFRGK